MTPNDEARQTVPCGQDVHSLYELQAVRLPLVLEGDGTTGTPVDRFSVVGFRHDEGSVLPLEGVSVPHAFVSQLLALLSQSTSFMFGHYSFKIEFEITTPTLEERKQSKS